MSSAQRVDRSNPFCNCFRMCCDKDDAQRGVTTYHPLAA
jgi:hypothetical protein